MRTSDFDGLVAADAREFAFLEHPQQLGLRHGTEVPDFVEEQGAAVGELELADAAAVLGEGALFVAEQLALDHVSGRAAQFNAMNGRPAVRCCNGGPWRRVPCRCRSHP